MKFTELLPTAQDWLEKLKQHLLEVEIVRRLQVLAILDPSSMILLPWPFAILNLGQRTSRVASSLERGS